MSIGRETYEMIDQYLKGTLSVEERVSFEKQMLEDPMLGEEVKMQELLNDLILEKGLADIRKKVGEDFPGQQGPSNFKKLIWGSAGILIIAAGISYFSFNDTKVSSARENRVEHSGNQQAISSESKSPANTTKLENNNNDRPKVQKNNEIISSREGELPSVTEASKEAEQEKPQDKVIPSTQAKENEALPENSKEEPCKDIIFGVQSEPSCLNKQTGKIQIVVSGIKGGKAPYTYSIGGKEFGLESVNSNLGKGNYIVEVKDSKGCISEKHIQIPEKACIEYKDYSFNPAMESWKLPLDENETGTLTISDRSGRILYTAKVMNGSADTWDGRSLNGEMLESGSYLYIVESNRTIIKQGYITILH